MREVTDSYVRHLYAICATCLRMSGSCRISMSHVTTNESCHTYERVMSHTWMSHVTHMNESCQIYKWVISHIWMSHVTHTNESSHTYEWVVSQVCSLSSFCLCVCVCVCVGGCVHEFVRTKQESHHVEMRHLAYEWVMSHMWMRHVTHVNETCHKCECVMLRIWMVHVSHVD